MIHGSTSGISFSEYCPGRHLTEDATQHTDAQQAEIQQAAEDSSPGAEVQNLSSRRTKCQRRWRNFVTVAIMKKKSSNLSNSFERVLEDEALPKAKQILKLISVHGGALEDFYVRRVAYFLTPVI